MYSSRYGALRVLPGGMGGFGAFGAGGAAFPVVGKLGFTNEWTYNDWRGGSWLDHINFWKIADYEPLSDSIITRANQKFQALSDASDAGSVVAGTLFDGFSSRIKALTSAADTNTTHYNTLVQMSDASHRDRARIFTDLNKELKKLANAAVPQPVEAPSDTSAATYVPSPRATDVGAASAGGSDLVSTSGGAPSGGGMLKPILIGAAVLVPLSLVAFFLLRKKAPTAVAGYRRRRTRRSRR